MHPWGVGRRPPQLRKRSLPQQKFYTQVSGVFCRGTKLLKGSDKITSRLRRSLPYFWNSSRRDKLSSVNKTVTRAARLSCWQLMVSFSRAEGMTLHPNFREAHGLKRVRNCCAQLFHVRDGSTWRVKSSCISRTKIIRITFGLKRHQWSGRYYPLISHNNKLKLSRIVLYTWRIGRCIW